jgi:dienelactone hydrolase
MLAILLLSSALAAEHTTLTAADGTRIHALTEAVPGSEKGVVLVHMLSRHAGDWAYFGEKLAKTKLQVVMPDLRGHGANVPEGQTATLSEADYAAMEQDVRAAVGWLRAQGVKQVSCAGASIGANLCARVAADDPQIVNLVLLSPGLNYKGVKVADAVDRYGDRPLLMAASEDDPYSYTTVVKLEERAKDAHVELYAKAGHGTKMLSREPELEGMLQAWLLGTYKLASGEVVRPRPGTAATKDVHTSGEKLNQHK